MSDGGATPRTPRSPGAARCTTVTEGDSEEGSTARSGGSTPNPGAALRASSSGVVRTELSKVSEDGAAEEGSGKAAAPEAVRSSQQWLERELELSLRAEDDEEQEAAAAAEAPAPAPDYGRSPSDPGQSSRRSDPSRRQSDPPPPEASVRSSSADAVQLITRRSSMLLSLIESEEKRIHDLMELHPSQNPAHHHRASVHRPHRGSVLGGSQRGSQLKTATAAAALASALSRGSSVLSTDSASQGGTPQGSCRGSRKLSASAETALDAVPEVSRTSEEVLPPMPEPSTAGEESSVDYSTRLDGGWTPRETDDDGDDEDACSAGSSDSSSTTDEEDDGGITVEGSTVMCATASDRDSFASARSYSYV